MKDKQVKVESHRSFTKNPVRGSVVNVDNSAYTARCAKLAIEEQQNNRIEKLENDIGEIKSLLNEMINKQ